MEGKNYHYMFFLPGDDARDSCYKFYEWLDAVYIESGLPCTSFECTAISVLQYMTGFLKTLFHVKNVFTV